MRVRHALKSCCETRPVAIILLQSAALLVQVGASSYAADGHSSQRPATTAPQSTANSPSSTTNKGVTLLKDAVDETAGGLACFRIETPTATWLLEKSGAGLSSLIDRDGNDWLGFHPQPGSGAAGEYRGFPNAVHRQGGSYFHPRNKGTGPSTTSVTHVSPDQVSITARAGNGEWECRYDFFATHCTFSMTRLPPDRKYWVLYEGTPGGEYDDSDWWMTSGDSQRHPLTRPHQGDLASPEWIAFGDRQLPRVLVLLHHEDDNHPDHFYQMQKKMTVFGFGRAGLSKFLESVPQHFSIGLIESSNHSAIGLELQTHWRSQTK